MCCGCILQLETPPKRVTLAEYVVPAPSCSRWPTTVDLDATDDISWNNTYTLSRRERKRAKQKLACTTLGFKAQGVLLPPLASSPGSCSRRKTPGQCDSDPAVLINSPANATPHNYIYIYLSHPRSRRHRLSVPIVRQPRRMPTGVFLTRSVPVVPAGVLAGLGAGAGPA